MITERMSHGLERCMVSDTTDQGQRRLTLFLLDRENGNFEHNLTR